MDLSVVIVSYNVSALLRQCLLTVNRALQGIDSEIYVVDNNSSDDSCSVISSEFPEVNLIPNKVNSGFSAANNQAVRLARGTYILLLNPDTLVQADTFTRCIRFMDSHPDAGALGVKMINGEGEYLPESKRSLPAVGPAFFKSFGFSSLFPNSEVFNAYYLASVGHDQTARTEVIAGAFMFLRREVLDKTGLMDEDYFMYGEDIDLSYRIIKAGYSNYYFPEVIITHFKGCSTPRNQYDDILNFYKAMRIYLKKRSAEGEFRYTSGLMIAGILLRETLSVLNRFLKITFRG